MRLVCFEEIEVGSFFELSCLLGLVRVLRFL